MTGRVPIGPDRFPALTDLRIRCRVPEAGGLALLATMPNLGSLDMSGPSLRDDDLRPLTALSQLGKLTIENSTLDGTALDHLFALDRLETIQLIDSNFGDAALPILARLPALADLYLGGTAVTAAGLEQLRPAPRLASLCVYPPIPGDRARLAAILPRCDFFRSIKER